MNVYTKVKKKIEEKAANVGHKRIIKFVWILYIFTSRRARNEGNPTINV